jgi:hypothetical protein
MVDTVDVNSEKWINFPSPHATETMRRNVTGIAWLALRLEAKRLRLLHELVPQATPLGVLLNPFVCQKRSYRC